jgi:peptidoglycan/LPS O-acetylase OafA/YrhL/lysophospholipase L1-like esterase
MPQPVRAGQRYMPGLDGLRALAVLAVIAYHEQFGWAPGGLLGVGVFFTLSGYLITDLLLGQWAASGRLWLGDFWLRRARRLLPALFVMLIVVTAWVTLLDSSQLASLRGAVGAAAAYWSNWYVIAAHSSYFARFAPPAPLDHLWSLAVEEQFYLLWPWLLLLGVAVLHAGWVKSPRWLALPTLALAGASAAAMTLLYHPGFDPTRVYEGTDTRASGLLIGAALAMAWPSRRTRAPARGAGLLIDAAGIAGLAVIAWMIWRVGEYSLFAYRGGLDVLSVAAAAVVAAAACPGSVVAVALGWRPLRWLGVRSYGIYLWHFPVIVLTSPANSTESLPRAAAQIAASIVLAALSWRFVEEPIRHGALGRLWARARVALRRLRRRALGEAAAATGAIAVLVLACAGLAGFVPPPPAAGGNVHAQSAASAGLAPAPPPRHRHGWRHPPARAGRRTRARAAASPATGLRTSCRSVVHIGDSTSDGLISPAYIQRRSQRIAGRYAAAGVRSVRTEISGARSIVETLSGQVNGYDVAQRLVRQGYRGCWVIALGTNDTANVAVGSGVSRMARIQRMMAATHGQPVLWVDVKSLLANGAYAEPNMRLWNTALRAACAKYPNMRIFDWASLARNAWFISDGVHYTPAGYVARARLIAQALAKAFPGKGHSNGCVVR